MAAKLDALHGLHTRDLGSLIVKLPETMTYNHRLLIWGAWLLFSALYLRSQRHR